MFTLIKEWFNMLIIKIQFNRTDKVFDNVEKMIASKQDLTEEEQKELDEWLDSTRGTV